MTANWMRWPLLPLVMAGGLAACDSNAVQPGIVNTSSTAATAPASGAGVPGESGRVVSIHDVALRGGRGSGSGNGPLVGGIIGAAGGAAIGGATSRTIGGGLVGALLGAVGGAIAGSIFDGHGGGTGRGIEVTVQKDDGQSVVVAQRDDGDIQLGDRVQIVQDRGGVAKVVRDTSRTVDPAQYNPPPQQNFGPPPQRNSGPPSGSGPPPGYRPPQQRDYQPLPDYRQSQYAPRQYSPQPQDDPRYGNLQ
jgi:outer membrane lipoprotein SlyB